MSQTPQPKVRSRAPRTSTGVKSLVRVILSFIVVVVLVDSLVGEKGLFATMRARREYTGLADEIGRIRAENAQLREQARRLKEDPYTIEEIARRELGLIRPGETLVIVKDVEPADIHPRRVPAAPDAALEPTR